MIQRDTGLSSDIDAVSRFCGKNFRAGSSAGFEDTDGGEERARKFAAASSHRAASFASRSYLWACTRNIDLVWVDAGVCIRRARYAHTETDHLRRGRFIGRQCCRKHCGASTLTQM